MEKPPDKQPEPETTFYVVAETACPACKGRCRESKQSRRGEPDYCQTCGGHGALAKRMNLKDALASLGVAVNTTETSDVT